MYSSNSTKKNHKHKQMSYGYVQTNIHKANKQ